MVLPILTYNNAILNRKAEPVTSFDAELTQLINSMFETMANANGVGLAAPQIGESIRLFVLDADIMLEEDDPEEWAIGPNAFINPKIIDISPVKVALDEGCLSLPDLRESVVRPESLTIRYIDRNFQECERTVGGWLARVIQHEYDHLDGILFFERLGSFKRRLIKSKLDAIAEGRIEADYPLAVKS